MKTRSREKNLSAENDGYRDRHESLPATPLWFKNVSSSDKPQETSAGFGNYSRRKRHALASQLYSEDSDPRNPRKTSHPASHSPAAKKPRLRTRLVPLIAEGRMDVEEIEEERQSSKKSREESDRDERQEGQAPSDEEEVVDEGQERESGGEVDVGGQEYRGGSDEGGHYEFLGIKLMTGMTGMTGMTRITGKTGKTGMTVMRELKGMREIRAMREMRAMTGMTGMTGMKGMVMLLGTVTENGVRAKGGGLKMVHFPARNRIHRDGFLSIAETALVVSTELHVS